MDSQVDNDHKDGETKKSQHGNRRGRKTTEYKRRYAREKREKRRAREKALRDALIKTVGSEEVAKIEDSAVINLHNFKDDQNEKVPDARKDKERKGDSSTSPEIPKPGILGASADGGHSSTSPEIPKPGILSAWADGGHSLTSLEFPKPGILGASADGGQSSIRPEIPKPGILGASAISDGVSQNQKGSGRKDVMERSESPEIFEVWTSGDNNINDIENKNQEKSTSTINDEFNNIGDNLMSLPIYDQKMDLDLGMAGAYLHEFPLVDVGHNIGSPVHPPEEATGSASISCFRRYNNISTFGFCTKESYQNLKQCSRIDCGNHACSTDSRCMVRGTCIECIQKSLKDKKKGGVSPG